MTEVMNIDLVAATCNQSANCFTVGKDGTQVADFRRVVITVLNPDGSQKKYIIHRQNRLYAIGTNHSIETYTIPANATWYDSQRNRIYKLYDNESFKKKLERLTKELRKLNYESRIEG
jgi:hypothetical protein